MIGMKKVYTGLPGESHLWRESRRVGWYRAACGIQAPWFDIARESDDDLQPTCKRCLKWIARQARHEKENPDGTTS